MTVVQLTKLSGSGFTILPNRIVDSIIKSRSKYAADTLSLALYLVRHIKGQCGSLILVGEFSQSSICEDLGWGITNRGRLKRALTELEQAGVIVNELQTNNTVVLHIQAEIDTDAKQPISAITRQQPAYKDFLGGRVGGQEFSAPPPYKDSSQGILTSVVDFTKKLASEYTETNKIKQNKNHHPPTTHLVANHGSPKQTHDDDVDTLLRLYRSLFKKFVSTAIGVSFAETYWKNDRPFELVKQRFHELAMNPVLHALTTSPNAVWEFDFMCKKSKELDQRIRQALETLRYSADDDAKCRATIANIIKSNGFDSVVFNSFYAELIAVIFTLRSQDRLKKAMWKSEDTDQISFEIDDNPGTLQELSPRQTDAHGLDANDRFSHETLELSSKATAQAGIGDHDTNGERSGQISLNAEIADSVSQLDLPESEFTQVEVTPINLSPSKMQTKNRTFCGLNTARSKNDLLAIIQKYRAQEECYDVRQRLETLLELACQEAMSFSQLRVIMLNHFGQENIHAVGAYRISSRALSMNSSVLPMHTPSSPSNLQAAPGRASSMANLSIAS